MPHSRFRWAIITDGFINIAYIIRIGIIGKGIFYGGILYIFFGGTSYTVFGGTSYIVYGGTFYIGILGDGTFFGGMFDIGIIPNLVKHFDHGRDSSGHR